MKGLNPVCQRFNTALMGAMAAIHHLSDHDCVPLEIKLSDRKPVITIEPPQQKQEWLRGAMKRRITVNRETHTVMAAPFFGCQVEWAITEVRTLEAQQA